MNTYVEQVGGDHYGEKDTWQHWDFASQTELGYLEGCATKYIGRWRKKGGKADLQKALSYIQKIQLMVENHGYPAAGSRPMFNARQRTQYLNSAKVGAAEGEVITLIDEWLTSEDLVRIQKFLQEMIHGEG